MEQIWRRRERGLDNVGRCGEERAEQVEPHGPK